MSKTTEPRRLVKGRWPYASIKNHILCALATTPFRSPVTWGAAVACFDGDDPPKVRLTSRAELASEFRASDLPDLARECLTRKVRPGSILLWAILDDEELGSWTMLHEFNLTGRERASA